MVYVIKLGAELCMLAVIWNDYELYFVLSLILFVGLNKWSCTWFNDSDENIERLKKSKRYYKI